MNLEHTATAPEPSASPTLGAWLGRYRLVGELGAGGMGVVYEAIDLELQRRVAIKVLRAARGGTQAQQRLLREARAMARLQHPNVVTVHEVGTADGLDYVVMELVDGATLARWIEHAAPSRAAIIDAFVEAGRGLAAAHAAGIVHRDFKPHNVLLRDSDRQILVGDFGLACDESNVEFARGSSTRLGNVTETGTVFGTPAYMAPEQWESNAVAATDQFAFCVALWEALAGCRPYASTKRVDLGTPCGVVPRRLRAVLERGLSPDVDARWPNMDALLAALETAHQRSIATRAPIALAAIALVGIAIAASALALVPSRSPTLPPAQRVAELHCLHAVLARFDAAPELRIDPEACTVAEPPRLAIDLARCTRAIELLADARHESSPRPLELADEAARAAQECGDDRLHAEALLAGLLADVGPRDDTPARLEAARTAVERVAQPDLLAALDVVRARVARDRDLDLDEAIAMLDRAIPALARRPQLQIAAIEERSNVLVTRGRPDDLERVRRNTEFPEAPHPQFHLAHDAAFAHWLLGDLEAAHRGFHALRDRDPFPRSDGTRTIRGVVVDERGRPIPGATVAAGLVLHGDARDVGVDLVAHKQARVTTTDARGTYVLDRVEDDATIIAAIGDRRTRPILATHRDRLVLAPTTRIAGRATRTNGEAFVVAAVGGYRYVAPIAPDGSYVLAHVPVGRVELGLVALRPSSFATTTERELVVPRAGLDELALTAPPTRRLRVTIRSATPLVDARVFILRGHVDGSVLDHPLVVRLARSFPGSSDLVADFVDVPGQLVTACAIAISGPSSKPSASVSRAKLLPSVGVHCRPLDSEATRAAIDVAPTTRT